MDKEYLDDLARTVTKTGRLLLENGAEVYRVEESMYRLAKAYGASTVDSYATPTVLIISFTLNGQLSHNVKRVKKSNNNLMVVDKVNDLIRNICKNAIPLKQLDKELDDIELLKPYGDLYTIVASMISCFGFALFFSGSYKEVITSTILGGLVQIIVKKFKDIGLNDFFVNIFASCILTVIGLLLSYFNIADSTIVITSVIMLLVPGMLITNAIRDSINGDLNSSLYRFLQAIFITVSIGLGSGLAYLIMEAIRCLNI